MRDKKIGAGHVEGVFASKEAAQALIDGWDADFFSGDPDPDLAYIVVQQVRVSHE